MEIKYIVTRPFSYGDIQYERGMEFEPAGGKFDKQLLDPANRYVRVEQVVDVPAEPENKCTDCGREFTTPQGLAAHSRHCKAKI